MKESLNQLIVQLKEKKIRAAGVAVVSLSLVFILAAFLDADRIAAHGSPGLEVQALLEMSETTIAAQMAGTIKEVHVAQGDRVQAGQLMAVLDNETLLTQKQQAEAGIEIIYGQIHSAQASQHGASAQLDKVKEGARREELDQAKTNYDLALTTYQRIAMLYENGAVSAADHDKAKASFDVAKSQYDMAKSGARSSEVAMAAATLDGAVASSESLEGQLKKAQAALAEIETYLAKTEIYAPTDGVVTQLSVEKGELVTAGSKLVTIADDRRPWIQCNLKETELAYAKPGTTVNLHYAAYPGESFTGTVVSVNSTADFAVKRATTENGDFDIRAFGVRVEPDQSGGVDQQRALYAGMTVFVTFPEADVTGQ